MPSYLRRKIIAIGFSLLCLVGWYGIYLYPTLDTDFGWHYRCGEQFLTTGSWCQVNRYSYYLPNYYWGYSTLVYDLMLVLVYRLSGFVGTMHFGALIMTTLSYLWYRRYGRVFLVSYWIFFIGAAGLLSLGFRAQILTLFYAGLFWLLLPFEVTKRPAEFFRNLALLMLFTIWANSHPGVVLFLGFYGLFCLLKIFERRYQYFIYGPLAVLSTLLTFQRGALFSEAFLHYQRDLSKLIAEWTAPSLPAQIAILVSFAIVSYLIYSKKSAVLSKKVFFFVVLLIMTLLTYNAKRQLPLFSMLLLVIAQEYSLISTVIQTFRLKQALLIQSSVGLLFLLGLINFSRATQVRNSLKWYCGHAFVKLPCQSLRKLPAFPKRLFTSYEWGGFLIWQRPETMVFVDGRMPAWKTPNGESPYTTYLKLIQAQEGWEKQLAAYQTEALLIPQGTFLDLELLKGSDKWREVYRDDLAAYYLPKTTSVDKSVPPDDQKR